FVYLNGHRAISPGPQTTTDSNGRYTIPLVGPADYIVGALLPPQTLSTFYPGAIDPLAATSVSVKAGELRSNVNIALEAVKTFTIRGRAFNSLPQPASRTLPNGDRDPSVTGFALVPRGTIPVQGAPPQIPN